MAKRDKANIDIIFNEVLALWIDGYQRKAIVQYCAENHGISERHTDNYLAKVYKEISNNSKEHRTKLVNQSLRRYNDLYDRNLAIQDYRECRAVQDSIVKLFGISEPNKIDVTTEGEKINQPPVINVKWIKPDNTK